VRSPDRKVTVGDVMTRHVVSVTSTTSVLSARRLLHTHDVRHLPVVDDGRLVGILSDRDLTPVERFGNRRSDATAAAMSARSHLVRNVMSAPVRSARPDDDLLYAIQQMLNWKISALPVVDHGHLAGMLTTTDCLATLMRIIRAGDDAFGLGQRGMDPMSDA
jgi:acetoin utilization protein AcuB